jgi:hypothetical protein
MLPFGVQPPVACKLLLTAAVRQHVDELQYWLHDRRVLELLDSATYEAVYLLIHVHDLQVKLPSHEDLPAAAQLTSDAIGRLLLTAAAMCRTDMFRQVLLSQLLLS